MFLIVRQSALRVFIVVVFAVNGLGIARASAEVIQVPIASQASDLQSVDRPERGLTKAAVIADFGEAITVGPAVGEPPISRWEYEDFFVYFEYEHVIHTVLKHRPVNLD